MLLMIRLTLGVPFVELLTTTQLVVMDCHTFFAHVLSQID